LQALKLFNALENWGEFMRDPVGMLIGFSGLTFYGGLICGGAAVLYIANKHNVKPLDHAGYWRAGYDACLRLGRIGCQMRAMAIGVYPTLRLNQAG
jgi:phosphatidylglycerol:prolipoprotein diacylglycerol transferase